jgi:hypothetical protein
MKCRSIYYHLLGVRAEAEHTTTGAIIGELVRKEIAAQV